MTTIFKRIIPHSAVSIHAYIYGNYHAFSAKPVNLLNELKQEAIDTLNVPSNIIINIPKKDITINFDHEKILIVFVNIILNAIQSIDKIDGHISIDMHETSSDVILEFENSGPNISSKDLKHLFDTLFTTKLEGTGLGLSSCKNIVEQHDGTITAKTNPVIFSIKLPKSGFKKN